MLLKQVVPRGAVNFFTFKKKENVEMKKLLFISIVVFLVACDDTASSQDQYFANLPQEKYSSSSFENIEESSSSQAPVVSLSSGTVEESSSSEVSSSSQEAAQDSEKQIPKLDKLPFDTTGIQPNLLKYTIDPDTYTDEDRAKNGPYLGHNITVEEWSNPSCTVLHVYESGKIVTDFVGFHSFRIVFSLYWKIRSCFRMRKTAGTFPFGVLAGMMKLTRKKSLWAMTSFITANLNSNCN